MFKWIILAVRDGVGDPTSKGVGPYRPLWGARSFPLGKVATGEGAA